MEAHEPYLPPKPFGEKFGPPRQRIKYWHSGIDAFRLDKETMSAQQAYAEAGAYEASIAYFDQQVGELMNELQRQSLLDNTLIIVTSDHGEQLGEHGLFGHGNSLYRQLLHVPLLIHFRNRVPAGMAVHDPVSLRDLPATVMDLIGLKKESHFPGSSWSKSWSVSPASDAMVLAEAGKRATARHPGPLRKSDMHSVVGAGYHYIESGGHEELYDLEKDPGEELNLAGSEEGPRIIGRFREFLAAILMATPNFHAGTSTGAQGRELDAQTEDRMRNLGY